MQARFTSLNFWARFVAKLQGAYEPSINNLFIATARFSKQSCSNRPKKSKNVKRRLPH